MQAAIDKHRYDNQMKEFTERGFYTTLVSTPMNINREQNTSSTNMSNVIQP
jgi:hypothetical protein